LIYLLGTNDDEDDLDLRTNPFQGGGDDGREPSSTPHERQELNLERLEPSGESLAQGEERLEGERLGPLTRSMTKLRMGALGQATNGIESNMYMLHEGPLRVA